MLVDLRDEVVEAHGVDVEGAVHSVDQVRRDAQSGQRVSVEKQGGEGPEVFLVRDCLVGVGSGVWFEGCGEGLGLEGGGGDFLCLPVLHYLVEGGFELRRA